MIQLILKLEQAMDEHWDDMANAGYSVNGAYDMIYDIASELQDMGVGAVLIPTMQGRLKWFDLDGMEF